MSFISSFSLKIFRTSLTMLFSIYLLFSVSSLCVAKKLLKSFILLRKAFESTIFKQY